MTVIRARADRISKVIRLGTRVPVSMVLAAGGRILYVGTDNGVLAPVPVHARRPGRSVRIGGFPQALVTSWGGRMVYAVSGQRVVAVRARARSIAWAARVGGDPENLALAPGDRTLYVVADPTDSGPGFVVPVTAARGSVGRASRSGLIPSASPSLPAAALCTC